MTGEVVCLTGLADPFYVVTGPLQSSELDNVAPERTDYLCEGYALRYLEIEAKLQVLQEEMGLVYGDAAISFEQHHCERPAGLHISNDIFRAHIQSEMDISCRIDDSDENGPHKRNEEGDDERPPGEICWPGKTSSETECNHNNEKDTVPPIGNGFGFSHHFHMVVIQRTLGRFGANPDLLIMKEEDMNKTAAIEANARP